MAKMRCNECLCKTCKYLHSCNPNDPCRDRFEITCAMCGGDRPNMFCKWYSVAILNKKKRYKEQ